MAGQHRRPQQQPAHPGAAHRGPRLLGADDLLLVLPGPARTTAGHERRAAVSAVAPARVDPYAQPGKLTPAGAVPIVRLTGIEKYFGSNHVLRGCNLEVYPNETVCIIGRSGSGKSTLLRCTNFLEEPTVGTVEVGDVRLEADPLKARSREHREQIRNAAAVRPDGLPGLQPLPAHDRDRQPDRGARPRPRAAQGRGHRDRRAIPVPRRAVPQARCVSGAPVRRREAARGDRPGPDHGAEGPARSTSRRPPWTRRSSARS